MARGAQLARSVDAIAAGCWPAPRPGWGEGGEWSGGAREARRVMGGARGAHWTWAQAPAPSFPRYTVAHPPSHDAQARHRPPAGVGVCGRGVWGARVAAAREQSRPAPPPPFDARTEGGQPPPRDVKLPRPHPRRDCGVCGVQSARAAACATRPPRVDALGRLATHPPAQAVPEIVDLVGDLRLELTYDGSLAVENGTTLGPDATMEEPEVRIGAAAGSYTLMAVDPDAPTPGHPKFRSYLHCERARVERGQGGEQGGLWRRRRARALRAYPPSLARSQG